MLREIRPGELGEYLNAIIIILDQGKAYTLERYLADSGCRILMDGKPERVGKVTDELPEPEVSEEQEPEQHRKRGKRKQDHANEKKMTSEAEEKIMKAWNRGERTAKEIQQMTGYSLPTIYKYIPRTPNG